MLPAPKGRRVLAAGEAVRRATRGKPTFPKTSPRRGEGDAPLALIILNQTQCPLCHAVIVVGDAYIATTAFIHDPADPLWPYSDAAIHTACFQSWPLRPDFVAAYNAAAARANLHNRMTPEGRVDPI